MDEKLMTTHEVADYLNIKHATLLNWIEQGNIQCPFYLLNGRRTYRFKREDVEKILVAVAKETQTMEVNHG